ncbi:testis-expressed protein 264 homolog [Nilaparvata lugens]|uniref:testis-expressed protein 264 homolog n=1 Tax=Nilaparvata lugens TaxID=108931 RepID=UPI00193CED35|nr:testis-expressed protein 264 homolog [Nilaparvata lugens]
MPALLGYFGNERCFENRYQITNSLILYSVKLCLHICLFFFIMFSISDVMNNLKFLIGFSITNFHDSFAISSFYNLKMTVSILAVVLFLILLSHVIITVCKTIFIKVNVGKPPFERLTIAYKFTGIEVSQKDGIIKETKRIFPGKRIIQINYSDNKADEMGIAFGAVLNEGGADPSDDLRLFLYCNDYRLFFIPSIHHAVFAVCPIVSWFAPTYWIAILSLYPKLFQFCQRRNLSAYPVVEILDNEKLTILAPLAQQNDFVVFEAEDIINRSNMNCSIDTSVSSSFCSSQIEENVSRSNSLANSIKTKLKKKTKSN